MAAAMTTTTTTKNNNGFAVLGASPERRNLWMAGWLYRIKLLSLHVTVIF